MAERPISELVHEYRELTKNEGVIKKRKEELSKIIKEHAMKNGVQNDTGSFYLQDDNYTFGSQAKKSVSLNFDRAKKFFTDRKVWDKVVVLTEKINEDAVEQMISNEEMTIKELEAITDVKVTYSIDVREKKKVEVEEPMPEVVQQDMPKKSKITKLPKRK